jgi:hypothetical protein
MTDETLLQRAYEQVHEKLEALPTKEGRDNIIATDDIAQSFGLDPEEVQMFFQEIMVGAIVADAAGLEAVHSSTLMMVFFVGVEYGRLSG